MARASFGHSHGLGRNLETDVGGRLLVSAVSLQAERASPEISGSTLDLSYLSQDHWSGSGLIRNKSGWNLP